MVEKAVVYGFDGDVCMKWKEMLVSEKMCWGRELLCRLHLFHDCEDRPSPHTWDTAHTCAVPLGVRMPRDY
jgi:hypothetical protein